MTDSSPAAESAWRAFWNRGGWWRALLAVAVYAVVYQLLPAVTLPLTRGMTTDGGVFSSAANVFATLMLPVLLGSVVLLLFAWSVGWLPKPLFTRQPVGRSWWMWIAPVLVAIPIVLRLFGTDYGAYTTGVIVTTFITGFFIGLSEELATRGIAVTLLRKRGYGEWTVAAVSSALFALMHSTNLFTGQGLQTVGFTLLYTFAFGVLMYLTMRVTGSIWWAVLLHGLTDPTTFLASGGIDEAAGGGGSPLLGLAGIATFAVIGGGVLLLIFIRGKARAGAAADGSPSPR